MLELRNLSFGLTKKDDWPLLNLYLMKSLIKPVKRATRIKVTAAKIEVNSNQRLQNNFIFTTKSNTVNPNNSGKKCTRPAYNISSVTY